MPSRMTTSADPPMHMPCEYANENAHATQMEASATATKRSCHALCDERNNRSPTREDVPRALKRQRRPPPTIVSKSLILPQWIDATMRQHLEAVVAMVQNQQQRPCTTLTVCGTAVETTPKRPFYLYLEFQSDSLESLEWARDCFLECLVYRMTADTHTMTPCPSLVDESQLAVFLHDVAADNSDWYRECDGIVHQRELVFVSSSQRLGPHRWMTLVDLPSDTSGWISSAQGEWFHPEDDCCTIQKVHVSNRHGIYISGDQWYPVHLCRKRILQSIADWQSMQP